ncbi:MAG: hypothetical protein LAP13_14225 [Acidobacteriia bacterium]|nr:hypothetical protein [Terriglobia bacterium]
MYKTVLVKDLIEDGDRLLRELDRRHFPISAAFWYDSPDRLAWNLYIVSEVADAPGPLEAYMRIQQAMSGLKGVSLSLDDIVILSPHSTAFRDLRRTIEGVSQMSASGKKVSLEGVALEDCYIYRWSYD